MNTLLWKDYRLSRICIMAGIIFIIVPYLFIFFPYVYWKFENAWVTSTAISQLTMAFLAGNIIVCERADRSAAFLAYQGISRKMVVASKLIICTIAFVSIYAISFVLIFWLKMKPNEFLDVLFIQIIIAATGFCFFGCCWLLSALLPSAISAIVFGILPPAIIGVTLGVTSYYLHWPSNDACPYWYTAFVTAIGLLSLVAGTWYFIRSKES